jgi:hypothetical protein
MINYNHLRKSNMLLSSLVDDACSAFLRQPKLWQMVAGVLLLPLHYRLNGFLYGMRGTTKTMQELTDSEFEVFKEILEAYDEVGMLLNDGELNTMLDRALELQLSYQHLSLLDAVFDDETLIEDFWHYVALGKGSNDIAATLIGFIKELDS